MDMEKSNNVSAIIAVLLVIAVCYGSFWLGHNFGKKEAKQFYYVEDFFPRKPYPTFFIEERGLKNPVIFDIHIEHSTLYVKAIGDGGKIEEDMVPLGLNKLPL